MPILFPDGSLTVDQIKALVRYAYLTDQPPAGGVYLAPVVGAGRPRARHEFLQGNTVALFYALTNAGRAFNVETRWTAPDGTVVRQSRVLDQAGGAGSWRWQTQSLAAETLSQPGAWIVEFVVDGELIGRRS